MSDRAASVGERLDEEGFTEKAVTILRKVGYDARRNEVGHLAIAYDAS